MIKRYYGIKDIKADCYIEIFTSVTDGTAVRTVSESVNHQAKQGEQQTLLSKYPDDFSLYYLSDFDDNTGLFVINSGCPRLVVNCASLKVDNSQVVS